MKRDLNLMRLLLLDIEKAEELVLSCDLSIDGYDSGQIAYHASLLKEAGLIVGGDSSTLVGARFCIQRLTFQGHDFLDTIRSPPIWRKTCDCIRKVGNGFVLSVVRDVAEKILRDELAYNVMPTKPLNTRRQ